MGKLLATASNSEGQTFIDIGNLKAALNTFLIKIKELFGTAFQFKGIAIAISADKTELTLLDRSKLKAAKSNLGHVYLLGDKEYASNSQLWVELGFSIDLTPIYNRLDKLENQVNKEVSKEDIEDMIDLYFRDED